MYRYIYSLRVEIRFNNFFNGKWTSLEQNGVSFTDDYEPHNVKLIYDGEPVELTPAQEEVATFYAAMPPDGPQLSNPQTAKVFNANFFGDFKVLSKCLTKLFTHVPDLVYFSTPAEVFGERSQNQNLFED